MPVTFEAIKPNVRLSGVQIGQIITVSHVEKHGENAINLIFKDDKGSLGERIVFRDDLRGIGLVDQASAFSFDGDPGDFKLAAEAMRIKFAALHDPLIAVNSSDLQPLPHQIRAVYGELLPRVPLRFLLADDPGAGKTIMAGLYIKELKLRGDLERCLIVAPDDCGQGRRITSAGFCRHCWRHGAC